MDIFGADRVSCPAEARGCYPAGRAEIGGDGVRQPMQDVRQVIQKERFGDDMPGTALE